MAAPLLFWISLATKLGVTAAFVVSASLVAERAGPLVGAMIATLPVSTGPAYVFLALEHDAAFVAQTALASLAANAANVVFALVYCLLAQRLGLVASVLGALSLWFLLALALQQLSPTIAVALLVNAAAFALALPISARFRTATVPPGKRRWYDVPLRALLVGVLVAAVVTLSTRVGPQVTGALSIFPVVLTGLMLIFHLRIGALPTAALIAHTIPGLLGFCFGLTVVHLTIPRLGVPIALTLGLAVAIGSNLAVWSLARRRGPASEAGH